MRLFEEEDILLEAVVLRGGSANWAIPDSISSDAASAVFEVTYALRDAGIAAEMDHQGRSLKAQLKVADRVGARAVVIIGDDEIASGVAVVRDMASGTEERVPFTGLASRFLPGDRD